MSYLMSSATPKCEVKFILDTLSTISLLPRGKMFDAKCHTEIINMTRKGDDLVMMCVNLMLLFNLTGVIKENRGELLSSRIPYGGFPFFSLNVSVTFTVILLCLS
eukprot:snap_masked-scaffold_32-processed-gene-2.11-mRNA-1 protein AED:1.00 eAED:1.00 QI:0/-1/0/0/-1/1/1/0/104